MSAAADGARSGPPGGEPLLAVQGLDAWYGAAQVLFGVSLAVGRGEVVALLGRNGAGKSTTFKAIMGMAQARAACLRFMGRDLPGLPPHAIARLGLGFVPEDRRIFTDLTVAQNLEVGRLPARRWPDGQPAPVWDEAAVYRLFPALAPMAARPGGRMSGGEQQMLTIGRTLMGNPFLLLLDEPSEGVAPLVVEQMAQMILALKAQGVSILLSEQNRHFAALVADRAYVLDRGQVRHAGPMDALADDVALRGAGLAF